MHTAVRSIWVRAIPMALLLAATGARGDPCRLRTADAADVVRGLIQPGMTVVEFCWYCADAEPVPLRIRSVDLRRHAPDTVRFQDQSFPVAALEAAETGEGGPLAEAIRAEVERNYADVGGYPNDPMIRREKRAQYEMFLDFVREDLDLVTWHQLTINGEPRDPRLLYMPVADDRYGSLGMEVDCPMGADAPERVAWTPPDPSPENVRPPMPYVADVTGQCYDGSCPEDVWTVRARVSLHSQPGGEGRIIGELEAGETVTPLRVLEYVRGVPVRVLHDHGRFLAGDVFYLLDSQAEGFYRVWHYGEVLVTNVSDARLPWGFNPCERDDRCWAEGDAMPEQLTWARVQRTHGTTGWVRDPITSIDGVLSQH